MHHNNSLSKYQLQLTTDIFTVNTCNYLIIFLILFIFFSHLNSNRLLNFDFNASFLGMIRWDFAITLFFIWFIVFITLRKPYIFSSNPTFCLAIVPTTVFGVLFFKSIFLPGSQKGLIYFFKPTWEGISQPAVS